MEDDYEFALRLQKELNQESTSGTPLENENSFGEPNDLDLAYRLQAEYNAELNDDSQDCLVVSDNLSSNRSTQNKKPSNVMDADLALALQLQSEWNKADQSRSNPLSPPKKSLLKSVTTGSIVDSSWELVDPCPDIHALFQEFNASYFWHQLEGVEVRWSPRMTLCAGLCVYEGRGGLCSVRLSTPLLKLRPRKDLVETLLHEMIHAYLFVTQNNKDHDGHGPEFHKHMYRINKLTGTNISVYHSFHQEVALYKQHWWRCSGVCRVRKPFYGLVKRSMNRAPSPRDPWWAQHQQTCGGTFVKIKSPEPNNNNKKSKEKDGVKERKTKEKAVSGMQDIRTMFSPQNKKIKVSEPSVADSQVPTSHVFPGKGFILGKS